MKMVLAIMPTNFSDQTSKVLINSDYRVTKFASTAGLFTGGTTTLMVGADDVKVESCLELIREQFPASEETDSVHARVTIYVLNLQDFDRV